MFDKLQRLIKFSKFLCSWGRKFINKRKYFYIVFQMKFSGMTEIFLQSFLKFSKNIDFPSFSSHHWYKIRFNPHLECTLSFKCCKSGKHSISLHFGWFHSRALRRHFGICVGESIEKANTENVSARLSHPSFALVTSSLHIEKKISAKKKLLQHVTVNNLHFQHFFLVWIQFSRNFFVNPKIKIWHHLFSTTLKFNLDIQSLP